MVGKNGKEEFELTILYDIFQEYQNAEGEIDYKVIKRNCKKKWYIADSYGLTDVREIPSRYGKPYKNKCEVFNRSDNKWVTVLGSYQEIKRKIKPIEHIKVKGFRK